MPGVVGFVSFKDIPGRNIAGHVVKDEQFFASEEVRLTMFNNKQPFNNNNNNNYSNNNNNNRHHNDNNK